MRSQKRAETGQQPVDWSAHIAQATQPNSYTSSRLRNRRAQISSRGIPAGGSILLAAAILIIGLLAHIGLADEAKPEQPTVLTDPAASGSVSITVIDQADQPSRLASGEADQKPASASGEKESKPAVEESKVVEKEEKKEPLAGAESRADASPLESSSSEKLPVPVPSPAEANSAGEQKQPETAEQQPIVQQLEEVPSVSGLSGLEEGQQVEQSQTSEQAPPGSNPTANQVVESNSASAGSGFGENDLPAADQFGRKTTPVAEEKAKEPAADNPPVRSIKGRSLKRAFGGHAGVFGRKRAQGEQAQPQPQEPYSNPHYYYQTAGRQQAEVKSVKLKSADYPDYREILVQPDQAERERATFEVQRQPAEAPAPAPQQAQPEEQVQPVQEVQQQVQQVQEVQQVQQVQQNEPEPVQEQTPPPVQEEVVQQQQQPEEKPAEVAPAQQQPYIRLSNIATINSTSQSANSSSGDVKLMRIYVIDLDQKLVVGGQQQTEAAKEPAPSEEPEANYPIKKELEYAASSTTTRAYQQQQQQASSPAPSRPEASRPEPPAALPIPAPEGYVLVDREALQANLSRVLAQMGHLGASYPPSNYSEHPQQVLVPTVEQSAYEFYGQNGSKAEHTEPDAYGWSSQSNFGEGAPNKTYAGPIEQAGYSAQFQQQQQPANHRQVYQSLPQYIAPQYKGGPDNEYQALGANQLSANYTPAEVAGGDIGNGGFVQAGRLSGPRQAQDKHHANYSGQLDSGELQELQSWREPAQAQAKSAGSGSQKESSYRSGQSWRPLDYSAPAYSQPPGRQLNGYIPGNGDHDVVSLGAGHQRQVAASHSNDGQHAPQNYQQQPRKAAANKQAPSYVNNQPEMGGEEAPGQQVAAQAHQSFAGYQAHYNASAEANYPTKMLAEFGQPDQQQYGSNGLSAYAKQPEQSAEAPRIPQAHSAGYRQRPQPSPSAYLAVSGPPISDGFYESAEAAGSHQKASGKRRTRPRPSRPAAKQPKQPVKELGEPELGYAQQTAVDTAADFYADQELHAEHSAHDFRPQTYQPLRPANQPGRGHPAGGYPAQGAKGLLSWETISSVASGAAKRLPSLSSILMPFGGQAAKAIYPAMGYQPANFANYPRSAHYDRDVSGFHKPYPLRHMSHAGSAAAGSYSDAGGRYQNQEDQYQQRPAGHHQDLASSAAEPAGSSETEEPEAALPENEETASAEPERPLETGAESNSTSVEEHAEPVQESAGSGKARSKPKAKRPPTATGGRGSKAIPEEVTSSSLEPAQAAVLSSIEQELAGSGTGSGRPRANRQPKRSRKVPAPELLEPLPVASRPSLSQLEGEQPGLLLQHPKKANHFHFPQPDPFVAGAGEFPPGPNRPAASVQIGQFKITPQTQFVQSIFEPSRQMLGQYFKQYIGQLHQFAG